jgi:hypothetical protein
MTPLKRSNYFFLYFISRKFKGCQIKKKITKSCTKKLASKNVRFSQNRRFKFLPIKKYWSFIYPLAVGCKNPFVNILFRTQMAAVKLVGSPKKSYLI